MTATEKKTLLSTATLAALCAALAACFGWLSTPATLPPSPPSAAGSSSSAAALASPPPLMPTAAAAPTTEARVRNGSLSPAVAYVTFAADSKVRGWGFCEPVPSGCRFPIASKETVALPTTGSYLSANISFNAPGSCAGTGATLGEVTINGPQGGKYDTVDISLVNGWNVDVEIEVAGPAGPALLLGPTHGIGSGIDLFGVFPNGCDICVAKQHPPCPWQKPCGGPDGGGPACGCHKGTQYNPSPVCQDTGVARGSVVTVVLL